MRQRVGERALHRHEMSNFEATANSIAGAPALAGEQHGLGAGLGGRDHQPAVAPPPRHGQRPVRRRRRRRQKAAQGRAARARGRRTAGRSAARASRSRAAARSSCARAAHRRAARSIVSARATASSSCGSVMTRRPTRRSPSARSDGDSGMLFARVGRALAEHALQAEQERAGRDQPEARMIHERKRSATVSQDTWSG